MAQGDETARGNVELFGTGEPASSARAGRSSAQDPVSLTTPQAAVLLVDDDALFRVSLARQLTRAGYTVVQAANAETALAHVESTAFDLLLTDVNMPGMDGLELLRRVREWDALVSIVLITGEPNAAAAGNAAALGAMHYLIKPVNPSQMLEIASRAVRMTRLARLQRIGGNAIGGVFVDEPTHRIGRDAQLARALGSLWLAHQPIVRADNHQVVGYEVLMRFEDASLEGPAALLALAEECGRLPSVGRTVRQCAARSAALETQGTLLFVNLHPRDLCDESLRSPNAPLTRIARRVVLEITERASLEGIPDVGAIIKDLRSLGFRLAVDDLGAGYSGLSSLTLLEPEVVKLDMSLVRDIHTSPSKRRIVAGLISLARELDMQVVSEGIESSPEHDVLVELGSNLLQGYYIGRPSRAPLAPSLSA